MAKAKKKRTAASRDYIARCGIEIWEVGAKEPRADFHVDLPIGANAARTSEQFIEGISRVLEIAVPAIPGGKVTQLKPRTKPRRKTRR